MGKSWYLSEMITIMLIRENFAVQCRWRVPAHCEMVKLVRSGTKQPQPRFMSAADKARLFNLKEKTSLCESIIKVK